MDRIELIDASESSGGDRARLTPPEAREPGDPGRRERKKRETDRSQAGGIACELSATDTARAPQTSDPDERNENESGQGDLNGGGGVIGGLDGDRAETRSKTSNVAPHRTHPSPRYGYP